MPLLFQKHTNSTTQLALWKIDEKEDFFTKKINLQQIIHHPHKRLQHLAGRYLLSVLIPHFPYDDLLINERGKPYLSSNQYQFSISHCGDYAAIIISSENACGIDVELFSDKTKRVKNKFLSEEEQAYCNGFKATHESLFLHEQFYTLCWCAKEAVYKWWGRGKIDFKQNIVITNIDMESEKITVDFVQKWGKTKLFLQWMLFENISIVWTVE